MALINLLLPTLNIKPWEGISTVWSLRTLNSSKLTLEDVIHQDFITNEEKDNFYKLAYQRLNEKTI